MCFLIDWTILHRSSEACSDNSLAKVVFGVDLSFSTMTKIGLKIRGRGNVIVRFTKIPSVITNIFGIIMKGMDQATKWCKDILVGVIECRPRGENITVGRGC